MIYLFWVSLSLVFYHYVGYGVLLFFLSKIYSKGVQKGEITPSVSVVIAAYNEEKVIREKLENTLHLDYPRDRLEIVVVADGSNDATPQIVRAYESKGVCLLHNPKRDGKTAALNRSVSFTKGEILLFSDANTFYSREIIKKLVSNFHDDMVGAVSGKKVIREGAGREATEGESIFWKYESFLKDLESRVGSITTADGEVFALRRSLFEPIPSRIVHDDMWLTLKIIEKKFRVVYETAAYSAEYASKTLIDEFHLKVRYASSGFQIVGAFIRFWPKRLFFTLEFFSHKALRWLMPFPLAGLFLSSAFAQGGVYRAAFWGQVLFYATALIGYFRVKKGPLSKLFYLPLYFSMGNTAALYGFFRFLRGGQTALWRKAER